MEGRSLPTRLMLRERCSSISIVELGTKACVSSLALRREWLAEVRPSAGDFGETSAEVVGRKLPIRGLAGDQQAALFGQGCVDAGALKCTFGHRLLSVASHRRRSRREPARIAHDIGGPQEMGSSAFALEGSVFVAGAALQWLRDGLQLIENGIGVGAAGTFRCRHRRRFS